MMTYLKQLSPEDGKDIYDMLQGIESEENGFFNDVKGMPYAEYQEWLRKNDGFSRGIDLEDWMVPHTFYWLYDGEKPVGHGRIRHWLTEKLKAESGHIGYAITVSQRGKGYGTEILRLLLEECRKMDIQVVQVGANKENVHSNKVILRNGGVLVESGEQKNKYYIYLHAQNHII